MCSASSAALSSATFFADADLVPAIVSAVVRDRIVPRDVPRSFFCATGSNEAAPGAARLGYVTAEVRELGAELGIAPRDAPPG